MPTRVPDLPPHSGEISEHDIVVMNTSTNKVKRYPMNRVRGSGIYRRTTPPTETHHLGGSWVYQSGDYYVHTLHGAEVLYVWEAENIAGTRWVLKGNIVAPTYHTLQSLGTDEFELATASEVIDHIRFATGDYYRNKTLGMLFGPYDAVEGFNFDVRARKYILERSPRVLQHFTTLEDTDAPKKQHNWSPAEITSPHDAAYAPTRGDTYLQAVGDAEHGGYRFTWDEDAYLLKLQEGGTYAEALTSGWTTISKTFARSPKMWLGMTPPPQDDEKYIPGDGYQDIQNSRQYPKYVVGVNPLDINGDPKDDIALRLDVWGVAIGLRGSTVYNLQSIADVDNPYQPIRNDALYQSGDYLIVDAANTTIIYGPYRLGETEDHLALPLANVLRGSITHEVEFYETTTSYVPPTDVTVFLPGHVNNVGGHTTRIVSGDNLLVHYVDGTGTRTGKRKLYSSAEVQYSPNPAITWGVPSNPKIAQIHNSLTDHSRDNTRFSEGDWAFIEQQLRGPYNEDLSAEAWPPYQVLRGIHTHTFPTDVDLSKKDIDYTPRVVTGDYYLHRNEDAIGDPTGRLLMYGPAEVALNGNINWGLPFAGRPTKTFTSTLRTYPVLNDAIYLDGDFITTSEGNLFGPYKVGQASNLTAWRENNLGDPNVHTHLANGNPITLVDNLSTPDVTDALVFEPALKKGDVIHATITSTGKMKAYKVDADHFLGTYTLGLPYNPARPTPRYFNTLGTPAKDDNTYWEGEVAYDVAGSLYGPYVEGSASDSDAWKLLHNSSTSVVQIADVDNASTWAAKLQNGALHLVNTDGSEDTIWLGGRVVDDGVGPEAANYVGATEFDAGIAGLVPSASPETTEALHFLASDGQWRKGASDSAGGSEYVFSQMLDVPTLHFADGTMLVTANSETFYTHDKG